MDSKLEIGMCVLVEVDGVGWVHAVVEGRDELADSVWWIRTNIQGLYVSRKGSEIKVDEEGEVERKVIGRGW